MTDQADPLQARFRPKTDAKGQKIVYTYDSYKRVTKVERLATGGALDPDQTTEYYYDTNPFDGSFTQYGWGRLNAVKYYIRTDVSPSPNRAMPVAEMYSYTAGGAVTRKKLLVAYSRYDSTTGSLQLTYTQDNEGRVATVAYPSTHDDQGNPVNGTLYTYGYDAASRLSSISDNTTMPFVLQSVSYNPAGQVTGMMYGDGATGRYMTESRGYNDLGQLTSISGAIMGSTVSNTYAYNPTDKNNGRISSMTSAYPTGLGPNETVNYTYDDLSRLAKAEVTGGWKQQFDHDGWGNLNGYIGTGGAPSYSPPPADPVTNRAPGGTYDANGNAGSGACYDIENRPTCVTPYSYAIGYAPDNKRIWEGAAYNDPGSGYTYSEDRFTLYGLDGQRVGIYRIRNRMSPPDTVNMRFVTMEENVWVGKKLLKTRKSTTTEVVLQDRLGSVLFRYNANTDAKKAYAYYPYGQSRGTSTPNAEEGFGTYTRLDNNENHYADQRYYNGITARFSTPDPLSDSAVLGDPESWNRYSYVGGDPVNFLDPEGLIRCGDLPTSSGQSLRQEVMANSDRGKLMRFVWHEGGTLRDAGRNPQALLHSHGLIAQSIRNRFDVANGNVLAIGVDNKIYWGGGSLWPVYGAGGIRWVQVIQPASQLGYGPRGASLSDIIVRAAGGTEGVVDGSGELIDRRGELEATLDVELGDPSRSLPGRIRVVTTSGNAIYVTEECYSAISAMQATNMVMDGSYSYNRPGFFVTSWKAYGNSNPDPTRLIDFGTVGGTVFYGLGVYGYARYPW